MIIYAHISLGMGKEEPSYVNWGAGGYENMRNQMGKGWRGRVRKEMTEKGGISG